jgi:hypothetical protein
VDLKIVMSFLIGTTRYEITEHTRNYEIRNDSRSFNVMIKLQKTEITGRVKTTDGCCRDYDTIRYDSHIIN